MIIFSTINGFTTIELKNPNLTDSRAQDLQTYFREAMTGKMRGYKRTPSVITLSFNFSTVKDAKTKEYITFYLATSGQELFFTDWLGNLWRGWIINQPTEFVDNGTESNSFPIVFRGAIVTPAPSVSPSPIVCCLDLNGGGVLELNGGGCLELNQCP